MGSDRDVVIFADDVDIPVGRVRDDIDLGIADEKVRQDIAHSELHGCHGYRAAHGAGRFIEPMADRGQRLFGLPQHHHRVAMEFLTGVGHPEPP
jgi:hypothetical protein